MPPKIRTSKDMIVEAGYNIADKDGIDHVNCRAIADELGCSTQPVFSRFPGMDKLKEEVFNYACEKLEQSIFDRYEDAGGNSLIETSVIVLTKFAREHRNLFRLIYLSDFRGEKAFMEERVKYRVNKFIMQELVDKYSLDYERMEMVFERISLLTHGICTVIATTNIDYSDDRVLEIVMKTLEDSVKNQQ